MTGDIHRLTKPTESVLRFLLTDPTAEYYGLQIMASTGLTSGTMYPLLARLVSIGWLVSREEPIDPSAEGRSPRRLYRFTSDGAERARISLARATPSGPARFGKLRSFVPKGATP